MKSKIAVVTMTVLVDQDEADVIKEEMQELFDKSHASLLTKEVGQMVKIKPVKHPTKAMQEYFDKLRAEVTP